MELNNVLSQSFENWLQTLEYAHSTVYASVRYVENFFFYLKNIGVIHLEAIRPETVNQYHHHLQTRGNQRKDGALSQNYITSNINAIKRFSKYLEVTGKGSFEITLQTQVNKDTDKAILTREEIKALYLACGSDPLGVRDRAILSIYYGCGLRRSEGANLDIKDIMLKEKLVFVRSGKGYKERYVPMTEAVKDDLENYIYQARNGSLEGCGPNPAFFISYRGSRMCGNALIERVHKLAETAGIQKPVGLHTLRHSIATHLLQSGMTLEEVSQFLGHSSLESTQIYTHLSHA